MTADGRVGVNARSGSENTILMLCVLFQLSVEDSA